MLEWVAISFSRASSWARDQTHILHCRQILYRWATGEAQNKCLVLKIMKSFTDSLNRYFLSMGYVSSPRYLRNTCKQLGKIDDYNRVCWCFDTGSEAGGKGQGTGFERMTQPEFSSVQFSSVQSVSHVRLFATPWTAILQASLSITNSRRPSKSMSIESVMPSSHLILCHPLLLLPSIFPSIRVFSNESGLCTRWPKNWSFSFNISPSNEHPGLISFRTARGHNINWLEPSRSKMADESTSTRPWASVYTWCNTSAS